MPNWNEVLVEINESMRIDKLDYIRNKYILEYSEKVDRNVICYYSGFLQKPGISGLEINDNDKNGIMTCMAGLDKTKGLDLFLHTPGGGIAATESIVNYLKSIFGENIRAVIPQLAMSAGTMIACSCKKIIMGKQSNLGPIDPQFNGIAAQAVLSEFAQAISEAKVDPATIPFWSSIIAKYNPTFIYECQNAIKLSESLVRDWLITGMFATESNKEECADKVLTYINSHDDTKTHSRHLHIEELKDVGIKILAIEDDFDDMYQDLLLTIHHCFMHTFQLSSSIKIIENQNNQRMVMHQQLPQQHGAPLNIKQEAQNK